MEVPHPRPGRTSHRGDQTRLRVHEGALPRAVQESPSARRRVGAGGPVHDAKAPAAPAGGGGDLLVPPNALRTDFSHARRLPKGSGLGDSGRTAPPPAPSTTL